MHFKKLALDVETERERERERERKRERDDQKKSHNSVWSSSDKFYYNLGFYVHQQAAGLSETPAPLGFDVLTATVVQISCL
jgi:hypothetical protein